MSYLEKKKINLIKVIILLTIFCIFLTSSKPLPNDNRYKKYAVKSNVVNFELETSVQLFGVFSQAPVTVSVKAYLVPPYIIQNEHA